MRFILFTVALLSFSLFASDKEEKQAVIEAAKNYIVSQHQARPELMEKALHPELAKRTHWQQKDGTEFIMKTSFDTMLKVAKNYNKNGDKFGDNPKVEIAVLALDKRIASVKLTADDWIDYMHLVKNDKNQWQIINVLWQYHDIKKHSY